LLVVNSYVITANLLLIVLRILAKKQYELENFALLCILNSCVWTIILQAVKIKLTLLSTAGAYVILTSV